jgi:hypothetical protein
MDVDECASSPCVIDFNSLQRGDYFCPCNTGYSGQNCSGDVDSIYGSSTTAQLSLRTTHDAVLWITTTALVVCRDRAMDPSCRKALRHFVNVLHASVPLWHTGNLPDLVKSLTQPAESGNWTPLQEAQEADITTGITTPSDLVRVYVLEKMTTATRAAASQAIEGLLNMSSTNLCCAIQMAMHNLVVLPSFGPIPADWWDADKEEAEAAPTAIAADLFKPQTTWWLSSDSNIGSCLLWTFQLHDAHNRAEVLYEYFVDKLSSQVFRSTSQRVRDAAVQRWAEMGRDGQSTRTVACPLLTQAGVEPWQHLPCPELQAQTLCSATLVHVLEIVMAHEPALCDPGRYDRFPWARSTQQRPARSGEDLVLMLLYMQQQRLDSMPFSISGAFGVRLCVHLAGWRFAQAVEQSWNGNRTLDWYRHVRRLAEGAAREDELVSRLLYGRGHERDSSTIDLDWIDISWEPQRMKPAIEWLRRAPVTSALLCCSNDELDSLVYLGRFVQSWTEWPHGKKQTWSRAQESLTATQIAELHQDQLNSVVALLVERIDKDHCKDHCSVVFVRNGSSCKRFLLLDHIIPAGSPVLLDAGEVARYLRGCHAHYAAQTIACGRCGHPWGRHRSTVVSTLLRPPLSTTTRCRRRGATAAPRDAGFSGRDGLGIARGDQAALSPLLERPTGRLATQRGAHVLTLAICQTTAWSRWALGVDRRARVVRSFGSPRRTPCRAVRFCRRSCSCACSST